MDPSSMGSRESHVETARRRYSNSSSSLRRHSTSSASRTFSTRHSYEATSPVSSSPHAQSSETDAQPISAEFSQDDTPPVYRETEPERRRRIEEEQWIRKRDYAIQISKIMGRQLVNGINGK